MRAALLLLVIVAAGCGKGEDIVDAPGTPADASDGGVGCAACGPTQVCVAYHDGTCSPNIRVECQERHPLCEGLNCIQDRDCEFWHCRQGMDAGTPYVCYSCPNDVSGAINCHGP